MFIVAPATLFGGEISFSADVNTTEAAVSEPITLELTVSGSEQNLPEPASPDIDGFDVFGAGRSQQFSFVNGVTQSSVIHRFMLVPRQEGSFTIPPLELRYEGKTYSTKPIKITVTQAASSGNRQSQRSTGQSSGRRESSSDDYFVETVVDKDTIYVNEQLTLTFRFYQGKRLFSQPEYNAPSATGFWVEDLPPQKNYYKTVKGRDYYVAEVKTGLFPTSPGVKTIGEAVLTLKGEDITSIFDRDFFGFFDRGRSQSKPMRLATRPIEVVVLPLPADGKPADYSGSVGRFKMSTSIDKFEVEVNQPVTVTIKLSGTGNIKTLAEPAIPDLEDFRVFSSGKSENVSKAGYVVGGSKSFEVAFVPKRPGTFTIPAMSSNYFDPSDGKYKTLAGRSFDITVTGVSNEEIAAQSGRTTERMDLVATDIRYIITGKSGSGDQSGLFVFSPLFIVVNLLPIAALVIVFAVRRHRDRLAGDVGYRRLRRAVKMARVRLAQADRHLKQNEADKFYTEISRALHEYIGDKFNISAHGMTRLQLEKLFSDHHAPENLQARFFEIVATCDEGRFSPASHSGEKMRAALKESENLIVEFEDTVK